MLFDFNDADFDHLKRGHKIETVIYYLQNQTSEKLSTDAGIDESKVTDVLIHIQPGPVEKKTEAE